MRIRGRVWSGLLKSGKSKITIFVFVNGALELDEIFLIGFAFGRGFGHFSKKRKPFLVRKLARNALDLSVNYNMVIAGSGFPIDSAIEQVMQQSEAESINPARLGRTITHNRLAATHRHSRNKAISRRPCFGFFSVGFHQVSEPSPAGCLVKSQRIHSFLLSRNS